VLASQDACIGFCLAFAVYTAGPDAVALAFTLGQKDVFKSTGFAANNGHFDLRGKKRKGREEKPEKRSQRKHP
jgi:hypothetical protein